MRSNSNDITNTSRLKNKGWKGMSQILDNQMPIAAAAVVPWWKTKFFFVTGALVLLGLGFFAGRITSPENAALSTTTTERTEVPTNFESPTIASSLNVANTELLGTDKTITTNKLASNEAVFNSNKNPLGLHTQVNSAEVETLDQKPHTGQYSHISNGSTTRAIGTSSPRKENAEPVYSTPAPLAKTLVTANTGIQTSFASDPSENNIPQETELSQALSANSKPALEIDESDHDNFGKEPLIETFVKQDAVTAIDSNNQVGAPLQNNAGDTVEMASIPTTDSIASMDDSKEETARDLQDIKPRTLLEEFKSEGYELGTTFGISSMRGEATNLAYNVYLSKQLWGPLSLGLSRGSMELKTNEFAYFSTSKDRTTGGFAINDEETKFRSYEDEQIRINNICFTQTGLHLTLQVSSFLEVEFAALRTKPTYLSYSGEYTFIDSTFKYKGGVLISAEQSGYNPGTTQSDEWGRDLDQFGIRNFTTYELGLRINLTRNIAFGGKLGFSKESPFTTEYLHNHLFGYENDQQAGRFVSHLNYVKAGITLYF